MGATTALETCAPDEDDCCGSCVSHDRTALVDNSYRVTHT